MPPSSPSSVVPFGQALNFSKSISESKLSNLHFLTCVPLAPPPSQLSAALSCGSTVFHLAAALRLRRAAPDGTAAEGGDHPAGSAATVMRSLLGGVGDEAAGQTNRQLPLRCVPRHVNSQSAH